LSTEKTKFIYHINSILSMVLNAAYGGGRSSGLAAYIFA